MLSPGLPKGGRSVAMTGETGGNDSFGNSFATGVDGCGAWLAVGTSAMAAGLGAGGMAASLTAEGEGGVLVAGVGFGAVATLFRAGAGIVFCAIVTVVAGVELFDGAAVTELCAVVTGVELFDDAAVTGLCAVVTGVELFDGDAVTGLCVVVAAIGPDGFVEPFETGPVAGLSATVELAVRMEAMAFVTFLVIVAIIAIAGFGSCVGAAAIELAGFAAAMTVVALAGVAAAMIVVVLAGAAAFAAFSGAIGTKAGVFAGSGSAASR
jgi:hypothetical protein